MANEGTLGIAPAQRSSEDLSKEQLQRRMEEARADITQTVAEIKDTVVHGYESVKETISETLDWREQFKKRPVAWSAGALGAGFLAGYGIAALVKGNSEDRTDYERLESDANEPATSFTGARAEGEKGPGLLERFKQTEAYDRMRCEAATVGNRLVEEVSKAALEVALPALVGKLREWLNEALPQTPAPGTSPKVQPSSRSGYRPTLERND